MGVITHAYRREQNLVYEKGELKQIEEIETAGYVCSDCKSFDMDESYDGVICWCKNGRDIDNDWNHKACIDFVPDS